MIHDPSKPLTEPTAANHDTQFSPFVVVERVVRIGRRYRDPLNGAIARKQLHIARLHFLRGIFFGNFDMRSPHGHLCLDIGRLRHFCLAKSRLMLVELVFSKALGDISIYPRSAIYVVEPGSSAGEVHHYSIDYSPTFPLLRISVR